jgi:hypothetical protein
MKKTTLLFLFGLLFSFAVFADIRLPETPKPKQNKSVDTKLIINVSKDAKEAKLIIPKSQLKQLRAELDDLDNDSGNTAANFSRTQTIVSGLFMSLAMVFGGVWFVRSRKADTKTAKTLIIGTVLFSAFTAATLVFANAGPPIETRSITSKIFSPLVLKSYGKVSGKIKLEVSNSISEPELIVPDVQDEKSPGEE